MSSCHLGRMTEVYREFRCEYLKLVGGMLAFALGPWIGCQVRRFPVKKSQTLNYLFFQALAYLRKRQDPYFSSEPVFESPNLALCLMLYLLNTGNQKIRF